MARFYLSIVLLAAFTPATIHAQAIRQPGYIVVNSGDTLRGWIGYRAWRRNPASIGFAADSAASHLTDYTVTDIRAFDVRGYDHYERACFTGHPITAAVGSASAEGGVNIANDSAFLRLLAAGPRLSLWEYTAGIDLFFLREGKDSMELIPYTPSDETDPMPPYRMRLATLIGQYRLQDRLGQTLLQARYDEHDLVHLVQAINGPDSSTYVPPSVRKTLTSWFAGAGGGTGVITTPPQPEVLGAMHFPYRFIPALTAGVDFSGLRDLSKWVVRLQLSVSYATYDGYAQNPTSSLDQADQHFQQWSFSPSVAILYHFTTRPTRRLYAGLRIAYSYSIYPQNYLEDTFLQQKLNDFIQLSPASATGSLLAGFRLDRHWELGLSAQVLGGISQSPYQLSPKTYLATAYYHLK